MNIPLPFRVAAGLVATGLDRLRRLPEDLPGISVAIAGSAVRASMRLQQEIASLATRGEELLAPLTDRPEEHPAWAHFDDEDERDGGRAEAVPTEAAPTEAAPTEAAPTEAVPTEAVPTEAEPTNTEPTQAEPGYDTMRVSQLRAHLDGLDAGSIADLLAYERRTRSRAAFVTTLENRLATLRGAS